MAWVHIRDVGFDNSSQKGFFIGKFLQKEVSAVTVSVMVTAGIYASVMSMLTVAMGRLTDGWGSVQKKFITYSLQGIGHELKKRNGLLHHWLYCIEIHHQHNE